MNIYRRNAKNSVLERNSLVLNYQFIYIALITSDAPLIDALLYTKNPKIRVKYPNFLGFALESASPRALNMYVTPTKFFET